MDFNNLGGGTAPEGEDRADEFFNIDMESGERFLLPKLFNVLLKSEHCFHFSCVPEEGVKDTGLVVNDTPAGSAMEEVEESVEMKEGGAEGGEGEAADAKEEVNKKKGPSNMVSGWGKGVKVASIDFYAPFCQTSVIHILKVHYCWLPRW